MRVTSKGQVTIPRDLRELVGIEPNSEVVFTVENGKLLVSPKDDPRQIEDRERLASFLKTLDRLSGTGDQTIDAEALMNLNSETAEAMAVLVDTNILVDIAVRDPVWMIWSRNMLASLARRETLTINPVIYAEFSVRYDRIEDVESVLPENEFRREGLPWTAAFAAGAAFRRYRQAGGSRERVLPDFLIGAHATIRGYSILTRDTKGYRTYFPMVPLISPETHP